MKINLSDYIGVIPDFPKKGISFKDISPLLKDPKAYKYAIKLLAKKVKKYNPTVILGAESRAFSFGASLAQELKIGFVMARKKGKLPGKVISYSYKLEYGEATIEIEHNILKPGDRVLLLDDLLATGGTLKAMEEICKSAGATPIGAATLITLIELHGDKVLSVPFETLVYLHDSY